MTGKQRRGMKKDNGTICSAFWHHTNIRGDDRVFPCCRFKTPTAFFTGKITDILTSEEYNKLREQSAAGIPLEGCSKCYHEEQLGKESLRQQFNKEYTTDTVELEYLEIGFDNVCNLTCDGCFDEFSSAWAKKNNPTVPKRELITRTKDIKTVPDTVRKIMFLGGEPLMTTRHRKLLKAVKNKHLVSVSYNTNGTFLLDNETIELLDEFKLVNFIVSIDGFGALNDRVRSGSNWNDVLKFIDQVDDLDFDISVHTTIHKNNWFGLEDLQKFTKRMCLPWTTNVLTFPKELDIIGLTAEDKNELIGILETVDVPNKEYILEHIQHRKADHV
jgi:sulfatase maturation enzyme AslB (radical SAM superfamily)